MARLYVVPDIDIRGEYMLTKKAPKWMEVFGAHGWVVEEECEFGTRQQLKTTYGLTTFPKVKEYLEVEVTSKVVKVYNANDLNGNGKGGK